MLKSLKLHEYHGIVLEDKDPKNQGRYKVHIPELMPMIEDNKGIWIKNQMHRWRYTPSEKYFCGEYKPLQPGMLVLVKFYSEDVNTGYVDRIVSDQIMKSMPKISVECDPKSVTDRDDIYLLYKTPKKHNMFVILEETSDGETGLTKELIPNSIHQYYNEKRTTHIINEDGVHLFTEDNYGETIEKNSSSWIKKEEKKYVEKDKHLVVDKSLFEKIEKDKHLKVSGKQIVSTKDMHVMTSQAKIVQDAPMIYLNCQMGEDPEEAKTNKGENEIKEQKKITQKTTPEKEDRPCLDLKG